MKFERKPGNVLLAAAGALAMVVIVLVGSVWLLSLPFIARYIPTFEAEEEAAVAPETNIPKIAEVAPESRFQPDCQALRDVLDFRIAGARGCQAHQQCGLSAPRERCMVSFGIGLRAPIETAILEFNAQCGNTLPLDSLDAHCKTPTREWMPRCESNQCVLRESDAPWLGGP